MRRKILNVVKQTLLVILAFSVFTALALADVIYLKDGSILRGKITEETSESITIEGEGYWTTVKRVDIQKIIREVEKPKEEKVTVIRQGPSVGMSILAGVGVVFLVLILLAALG